jgi:hypothetical protein
MSGTMGYAKIDASSSDTPIEKGLDKVSKPNQRWPKDAIIKN